MLFLATAVPVWVASQLLWQYGGGLNLWALKNAIEIGLVLLAGASFTAWFLLSVTPRPQRFVAVPVFLASAAFLFGGFKASNDFLDPPDLLLGLVAQFVGFAYLLREIPPDLGT